MTITLNAPESAAAGAHGRRRSHNRDPRQKCLTVPIQSLVVRDLSKPEDRGKIKKEDREKEGVFLVQGGKAMFRPVKTGIMGEMDIEVTEGVKQRRRNCNRQLSNASRSEK